MTDNKDSNELDLKVQEVMEYITGHKNDFDLDIDFNLNLEKIDEILEQV